MGLQLDSSTMLAEGYIVRPCESEFQISVASETSGIYSQHQSPRRRDSFMNEGEWRKPFVIMCRDNGIVRVLGSTGKQFSNPRIIVKD